MIEAQFQADVAVVGSGPGGATVARELSRAGKKVTLLEMGRDWRNSPLYGTYPGCLMYTDRCGMLFSEEGLNIIRGLLTGGSSNLYCGTAARPPEWLKDKYKVDIDSHVDETIEELNIKPLPSELMGESSLRVLEAANELGLDWAPYPKFMDPARCRRGFDCGAECMLGCRCKAKWTANEYLDQARAGGCELLTRVRVTEVVIEDGTAIGVRGVIGKNRPFSVRAGTVVLGAGGLGDPLILQKSGFAGAGRGLLMDPTIMVYGVHRGKGTGAAPPMAVGSYDDSEGFIMSHLIDPWLLFPLVMARKGLRYPLRWISYGKMLGIMVKVKDEIAGGITADGKISKPMTEQDQARLDRGAEISRRILLKAGCDADSIFVTPIRGTHPSGTVRIGDMLDTNLRAEVKNLYVCDASVFPEALDRPIVLTVIGLAKRLAAHLVEK